MCSFRKILELKNLTILLLLAGLHNSGLVFAKAETAKLPEGLTWLSNETDPIYSSPEAKTGGTIREKILSFPPTLRTVGPDSNNGFRNIILDLHLPLLAIHPNTDRLIPMLASEWAFGVDKKSMYFKLHPAAVWSDGTPVTADDFLFAIEFMRSKNIVAPWYNDYYTNTIEKVVKYDDRTLSVHAVHAVADLEYYLPLSPRPKHFYKGVVPKDFVTAYNWKLEPNTGAYQVSKIEKGKYIELTRKKDWWAKDLRYFKNRFNVDKVRFEVVREDKIAKEYFLKGNLDFRAISAPEDWHEWAKGEVFDKGYVEKLWFYRQRPEPPIGLYLNQSTEILKDRNVRLGLAHSINVDKLLKTLLRNDYDRLPGDTYGFGEFDNPNIKAREFDLKKAGEYFTKAGWVKRGSDGILTKDGKRLEINLAYRDDSITPRFVVLKEEAKKAGVDLALQLMDSTSYYKRVMEKKHEIAFWAWVVGERPQYWESVHKDNANVPQTNNITNIVDNEISKLADQFKIESEHKNRVKIAHRIQEIIYDNGAFIPLYVAPYFRYAYWRWWRFPEVAFTKSSLDMGNGFFDAMYGGLYWFDQQRYDETKKAMKAGKSFPVVVKIDTTYKRKNQGKDAKTKSKEGQVL